MSKKPEKWCTVKKTVVKVNDGEDRQPIGLLYIMQRWYWYFEWWNSPPKDPTQEDDFDLNGPFRTKTEALNSAKEYMGMGAPPN